MKILDIIHRLIAKKKIKNYDEIIRYKPKEDITVWELAQICGLLMNIKINSKRLKELPEQCLRHLEMSETKKAEIFK